MRTPAVVWAVGDGADESAAARRVAALIAADHPTRVLYVGDGCERGSAGDFRSHFATARSARRALPAHAQKPRPARAP